MKTTSFLISLLLVLTCTVHNAQSFKNASEYLDFIGDEQEDITKDMWNYTKAIAHSKSDKNIDNRRKRLLKTIESAITKIEKADGYGDTDYKSKVLRHMNFNRDLLN
ncbi:hypothetical protein [Sediminibacter sp. Hel_I_10]|uniref:hypothetical protein n=1 Tax=Sediminibacter sp. Hel_I_10 TaxID=1392490 RepID=UPI00047EEE08|nr:hypothetical protein [Sediminibacter sp. Hel_I_10]